jgi:CRISPR/Cas system-associated protein Cas10 (large subunit of type III CRISPR-Cas system)
MGVKNYAKFMEEESNTPYCGVCDTELDVTAEWPHKGQIWLTCSVCKEKLGKVSDLESLVATLEKKWLKAEKLYDELQDRVKCRLT